MRTVMCAATAALFLLGCAAEEEEIKFEGKWAITKFCYEDENSRAGMRVCEPSGDYDEFFMSADDKGVFKDVLDRVMCQIAGNGVGTCGEIRVKASLVDANTISIVMAGEKFEVLVNRVADPVFRLRKARSQKAVAELKDRLDRLNAMKLKLDKVVYRSVYSDVDEEWEEKASEIPDREEHEDKDGSRYVTLNPKRLEVRNGEVVVNEDLVIGWQLGLVQSQPDAALTLTQRNGRIETDDLTNMGRVEISGNEVMFLFTVNAVFIDDDDQEHEGLYVTKRVYKIE